MTKEFQKKAGGITPFHLDACHNTCVTTGCEATGL